MHKGRLLIHGNAPHGARFLNEWGRDLRVERTLDTAYWLKATAVPQESKGGPRIALVHPGLQQAEGGEKVWRARSRRACREGAGDRAQEENHMKPVRTFTVKRAGLRDPEPVVRLTPQESWDQVEMLRRLHEEFRGNEPSRIQRVVQRRPLNS